MNPFDFQVSKIIHDERIQQPAYLRNLDSNGTFSAGFGERMKGKLGQFAASLNKMVNHQAQPSVTKSASRLS